jgi:hypothetical protein
MFIYTTLSRTTQVTKKVKTYEMRMLYVHQITVGVSKEAVRQTIGNLRVREDALPMAVVRTAGRVDPLVNSALNAKNVENIQNL